MLKKIYLKNRPTVKVAFYLDAAAAPAGAEVALLCQGNGWQPVPMKRLKTRPYYTVTQEIALSPGTERQALAYRYRITHADIVQYENDWDPDGYAPSDLDPATDNSICYLQRPAA